MNLILRIRITLTGSVLKSKGDSVTLYLRNAPSTDPTARKTNSKPFIIPTYQQTLVLFGRIWVQCMTKFHSNSNNQVHDSYRLNFGSEL